MRNLTRITHLLVADLEEGKRLYQDTFRKSLNINYLELAFNEFDANIRSITKEIIDEVQNMDQSFSLGPQPLNEL